MYANEKKNNSPGFWERLKSLPDENPSMGKNIEIRRILWYDSNERGKASLNFSKYSHDFGEEKTTKMTGKEKEDCNAGYQRI